ncbi:enoyl-CoA hydratase/isomerase family protein [Maricaulis sp.]|uniref:enoyl-CoA hydratase/isomerase family protein n=1 Tax=unclassified Maricaulis TaxID=2632371 RepID=UPI001B28A31C|nr:enoyl-CoA hydratase/isomerase family protein [Maricaulis sp.]MBO6796081.1 enoyl-CoA hydratase/isomerase family protein [Maricaulis sp.]
MTIALVDNPVQTRLDGDCLTLTLNRPHRGNALTPELLGSLCQALDTYRQARTIVLTGSGTAFSCGGDIREFYDRSHNRAGLLGFARDIVGTLNESLLRIVDQNALLVCALNGPVTGGSIGLMLACDHVIASETAFAQPYYARVGFAPDGGWTAMMPDRAGTGFTRNWLSMDKRLDAGEMARRGLVDEVCESRQLNDRLARLITQCEPLDRASIRAGRLLSLGGADRLARALDAERLAFLELIDRDETVQRMHDFLYPQTPPKGES